MIKIVTGHSGPGGSTVALSNLCNLFNSNGLECNFYGDSDWVENKLNTKCFKKYSSLNFDKTDKIIWHFLPAHQRPPIDRFILSCHETNLYPVKEFHKSFDKVHYVSKFQKEWHGVDGIIIPNILNKFTKKDKRKSNKVAGVVGSIDKHKRVHLSIERALKNKDVSKIELWGLITDHPYFYDKVFPLLGGKVSYHGVSKQMQEVYDRLDVIYASSERECLPMVQGECYQAGVEYAGFPENTREISEYIFDDNIILEKWKNLLF